MSTISLKNSQTKYQDLLKESYAEATGKSGLIVFTKNILVKDKDGKFVLRARNAIKQHQLTNLFSKKTWIDTHKKGGHRKLVNSITGITIEYSAHQNPIEPGAATSIYKAIQEHLNILCNQIFCYKNRNWKDTPDYYASYERWKNL